MASTPEIAFATIVKQLAAEAADAKHMSVNGGHSARAVGNAVLAALTAGKADTKAGCAAFLKALAPAAAPAASLVKFGNPRQKRVATALQAAMHNAGALNWPVDPIVSTVVISSSPGDVVSVAGQPTVVRVGLTRRGDLTAAASVRWQFTGLATSPLTDIAVFKPGAAAAAAAVTIPPDPTQTVPLPFTFELLGGPSDLVGLTLGEPHVATGRLLPVVAPPGPQPGKATVDFDEIIGQIARSPNKEVVRQVKVLRHGSTHAPGTAGVRVSGLPAGVLVAAEPATFKAGQARSYVAMRFSAAGKGVAAAAPMTGQADLAATADLDPGSNASQQFAVIDGAPPPPPSGSNPFRSWLAPNATPLPWLVDGLSMNWPASGGDDYKKVVGHYPVVSSGGSHAGGRTNDWTGIAGGPLSKNFADYDDPAQIGNGTQLDFGSLGLGLSFKIIKPNAGFVVHTMQSTPDNGRPSWQAMASAGEWDEHHYALGRRTWALVKRYGFAGWQLVHRFDKEGNGGGYGITADTARFYGLALGRTINFFRLGYLDGGAGVAPLAVLGFARHDQVGPLEPIVPTFGGEVVVEAIDVSMHPPGNPLNTLVNQPFDEQVAAIREWIRGGYDGRPCYSPDHKDSQFSALAVAKKLGILISNFESSPREDGTLACQIGAAAWQGLYDFWSENADMVAGVGVYASTVLDRTLNVPGWSAAVDKYVELWGR